MQDKKSKFEAFEEEGDKMVEQAENLKLKPPFDDPIEDHHYLVQDRIPLYKSAIEFYELAYNEMGDDMSDEQRAAFTEKLDKTYEKINSLEDNLWYTPFEMTRNPRDPVSHAQKRPKNVKAPTHISPSLEEIDDWLCYGERPPLELLKQVITEALRDESKSWNQNVRIIVCAALLDDKKLFKDLVITNYASDYNAYRRQKADGMSKVDLGFEPSYTISARRLRAFAERYLDDWRSEIAVEISNWLADVTNHIDRDDF